MLDVIPPAMVQFVVMVLDAAAAAAATSATLFAFFRAAVGFCTNPATPISMLVESVLCGWSS